MTPDPLHAWNTVRRPVRLALTVGGLAMVVLAFGLLRLTLDEWHSGVKAAANNRLITVHAMSVRLPLSYRERIAAVPVQVVHYGNVFGAGVPWDAKESIGALRSSEQRSSRHTRSHRE